MPEKANINEELSGFNELWSPEAVAPGATPNTGNLDHEYTIEADELERI